MDVNPPSDYVDLDLQRFNKSFNETATLYMVSNAGIILDTNVCF